MKPIFEKKINDTKRIGIVYAAEWFGDALLHNFLILPIDYVVGQWHDYHDGEKSNIEGAETIAICRNKEDAEHVYNSRISNEDSDNFCYVIYNTIKKTFLDKGDFFTSNIGKARVFSNKYDAESSLEYYIKIYKNTKCKDTTLNLEIHPVRMEIINT
jgi:glycosyltransferase involved in cell wall biosynthesis